VLTTHVPKRIACFITPGKRIDSAVERAQIAETLGYEAVFVTHTMTRDGLMTLNAYVPHTKSIKLGTGVVPALPRHPVALAIEAATLDELSGGRLILGVGPSHAITMQNFYGLPFERPFAQMREYVRILRSIFTTGKAEHDGEFYKVRFAFMGYEARKDLPIYISALGPNMLRFCGEECDGTILWSCMPTYIREVAAPAIREAAEKAGRDPASVDIVAAIPCAVTKNVEAARAAFRPEFIPYMTLPFYRRVIEGGGFGDEIALFDEAQAAGDYPGMQGAISDRLLDTFAGIGSPEVVQQKIAEYRDAGVTLPAVGLFSAGEGSAGAQTTLEAAAGA
jgi:F420-dependent oxidoreductase-like protein